MPLFFLLYISENVFVCLCDKNKIVLSIFLFQCHSIKFSNGTKIVCDLEVKRNINKEGEIILRAKSVYSVTVILYPDGAKVDIS